MGEGEDAWKDWLKKTLLPSGLRANRESMKNEDYLRRLDECNIALLNGHGGLCSIDVDTTEGLQDMVQLNPKILQEDSVLLGSRTDRTDTSGKGSRLLMLFPHK